MMGLLSTRQTVRPYTPSAPGTRYDRLDSRVRAKGWKAEFGLPMRLLASRTPAEVFKAVSKAHVAIRGKSDVKDDQSQSMRLRGHVDLG